MGSVILIFTPLLALNGAALSQLYLAVEGADGGCCAYHVDAIQSEKNMLTLMGMIRDHDKRSC